jgi:hypothetical protein
MDKAYDSNETQQLVLALEMLPVERLSFETNADRLFQLISSLAHTPVSGNG